MDSKIFHGCMPALMTPTTTDRRPDFDGLVRKAKELLDAGMDAVVYCGSMGEWPLLTDAERQQGVEALVQAGVPTVVGTGAQNPGAARDHAAHAAKVGAAGLMLIPRVLSRGVSPSAQRAHFEGLLGAAPQLPAIIYNSPYYGYETRAELFFALREKHPNLVGFKEFGGSESLSYAAEHITSRTDDDIVLMVGVDTQVYHGYVNCGAKGAITGIGNCLPEPVLRLVALCRRAADGDATARRQAQELNEALSVLSTYDEGPDLVAYYKHVMTLAGGGEGYTVHLEAADGLSPSQRGFVDQQFGLFQKFWASWDGRAD